MNGWLKLHRKILNSDVAADDELLGMFNRLLVVANRIPRRFKGREIKPGQLVFAWRHVGDRLYPSAMKPPALNTIRRRITLLAETGAIEIETVGHQYTVVTIPNFARFQSAGVSNSDTQKGIGVSDFDTPADTRADTPADTDTRRVKKVKKKARPSIDDVKNYARNLDPVKYRNAVACVEGFHNHYTANGWRQGKGTGRPIKDWQAAFRGWVCRQEEFAGDRKPSTDTTPTLDYAAEAKKRKAEIERNRRERE